MSHPEQTPRQWFLDAAASYVEEHQGCPWCHGPNRVYRTRRGHLNEYHCGSCDFFVCFDGGSGRYFMAPGNATPAPLTMNA